MRAWPRRLLAALIVLMPLLGAPPAPAQDETPPDETLVRDFLVSRDGTEAVTDTLRRPAARQVTPTVAAGTPAAGVTPATLIEPGEYQSPTYGYSVTWDEDVWSVDQESTLVASGTAALDQLRLLTGTGPALYVKGARYGDTSAAGCVAAESEFAATNESRSEYGPYLQDDGGELAGEADGAAFAAFQYVFTPETGSPIDEVLYINCRLLPDGASLLFVLVSSERQFEPYLAEAAAVIDSLVVPAATAASPTAVADEGRYESPTYGFSVTWDEGVWSVDEGATLVASGTAALDRLRLVPGNGPALYIEGASYGDADAASCVSAESARLEADPARGEYRPYVQPDGTELAGEADGAAFAAFQYLSTPATGDPYQAVVYIDCRLLPGSGVSILFTLFARLDQFETYLAETEAVIATLELPAPGEATPVTTAVPTPQPIPEASLTEAWFLAQAAAATAEPSVAGPLAGELVQDVERVSLALVAANEQDFYFRGRFQNPSDAEAAPWDFGVQFRDRDGEFYRLIVDSEGRWFLRQGTQAAVQSGTLTSVERDAGATNALELLVVGDTGAFRVNGDEIGGPLDLSALSGPGEVSIGVAFFTGNTVAGAVSSYRDVELWRIGADEPTSAIQTAVAALTTTPTADTPTATPEPTATATPQPMPTAIFDPPRTMIAGPSPTADAGPATLTPVDMAWFDAQVAAATAGDSLVGPVSDELEHSAEQVSLYLAAVDVEDFYLRVEFENPTAADEHEWDFGVVFRSLGDAGHYRLTFDSSGRWYLRLGSDQIMDTGSVTTLDTSSGDSNLLELVVAGNTAAFRVNGDELAGPLDISALSGPGRVLIGTAFSVEGTIDGGVTRFRDLQVWPLEPAEPSTETPTSEPTATAEPTSESIPTIPGAPTAAPTSSVPLIPTQVTAGSYESPQFGYTLTWDASWYEFGQVSADVDVLQLANGTATVTVVGSFADGASALGCQESAVRVSANLPELSPVLAGGQPLAGGDDTRAWSVYRYRSDSGGVRALYFECRSMPEIEATVLIAMDTPEADYNTQAGRLAALLQNLVLP